MQLIWIEYLKTIPNLYNYMRLCIMILQPVIIVLVVIVMMMIIIKSERRIAVIDLRGESGCRE